MRGRRAALPTGPGSAHGLLDGADRLVVRRFSQDGTACRDFDFTDLPCTPTLGRALVEAFIRRTAPGTRFASVVSMEKVSAVIKHFARYLAGLRWPPREVSQLTPEHFDGFYNARLSVSVATAVTDLGELRLLLGCMDGIDAALAARMSGDRPKRPAGARRESYSRAEFKRIADAARSDLRAAARRIRDNRELLQRFRDGEQVPAPGDLELNRRLQILDHVDRFGDVPRSSAPFHAGETMMAPCSWVSLRGSVRELVSWLHLNTGELAAAAVLLVAMTGQNPEVVVKAPAAHHRADGLTGGPATAVVDLRKPRRGRRAWMSLALSEIPDWISIPDSAEVSARDELHTPFGVYALLHELTGGTRALIGDTQLLAGYHHTGGAGASLRLMMPRNASQLVRAQARVWKLTRDDPDEHGRLVPLIPTCVLLRLTYLELHQRPVAHTVQTAASTYLARNRGNVTEYRKVVAEALTDEVAKARARRTVSLMSAADVQRAAADPDAVAAEQGLEPATLKLMLDGTLDTVLAACTDNTNGPFSPGQPCRASFMLCLECECARALPRHLPLQILVHDKLAERREHMDALRWAQRFAEPHARLADLLDQHDHAAIADARAQAGPAEHALADRFLNRELDLR